MKPFFDMVCRSTDTIVLWDRHSAIAAEQQGSLFYRERGSQSNRWVLCGYMKYNMQCAIDFNSLIR